MVAAWWDLVFTLAGVALCVFCLSPFVEAALAAQEAPSGVASAINEIRALAKKAGFVLLDSSEINANPKDTKDWVDGVWTLPPTLSQGDKDRARYIAVGEADNFVLKFQKPH